MTRHRTTFQEDAELAARALEGNHESAMEMLAHKLALVPAFVARLNARHGNPFAPHELQDVVQDAQMTALRRLPSYEPVAPLQAWIYGVCQNLFRTSLRRRTREWTHLRPLESPEQTLVDPRPAAECGADEDFEAMLSLLGGVEAQVVRIKILEDLSFAELAERFGMTENTAKTRYYRGLAKLRRRLAEGREDS